jgi:hypothetical protein
MEDVGKCRGCFGNGGSGLKWTSGDGSLRGVHGSGDCHGFGARVAFVELDRVSHGTTYLASSNLFPFSVKWTK